MTLDKRTAALGIAAAAAVAAAVVVTVTNHGGSGASKQRKEVSAYVNQVNAVQKRMGAPLTRVLSAYRDFTSSSRPTENSGPELARAATALTTLDRRLARLEAPPEAKKLRSLLLSLVSKQAALTKEVRLLATFSPRFAQLLRRAGRANAALGAALQAVAVPRPHRLKGTRAKVLAAERKYQRDAGLAAKKQADAIDAYDAAIAAVLRALRPLEPPPALEPSFRAQIAALQASRVSGARLATELRQPVRTDVSTLARRFALSSRIAQSTAVQKAQIAAIRRYNARAKAIGTTGTRVQEELARLQRDLP
jgi:hypothetical protein